MDCKKMSLKKIKKYMTHNKAVSLIFSNMVTPFSIKFFLYSGMTANQISILNLLFVLIPAPLIAFGDYWIVVLGCFLLQIHIILDYTDGAISRIKKTISVFGLYYEGLFHDAVPPILMLSLGINSYMFFNNPIFLFLGGFTAFIMLFTQHLKLNKDAVVLSYIFKTKQRLVKKGKLLDSPSTLKQASKLSNQKLEKSQLMFDKIIKLFSSYSRFLGILLILAIFNVIQYAIIFYSLFYSSIAVVKFYLEMKKGFEEYKFAD